MGGHAYYVIMYIPSFKNDYKCSLIMLYFICAANSFLTIDSTKVSFFMTHVK